MKYLLKSSFVLILLISVFSIGISDAHAEKAKASEAITNANKIENLKTVSLKTSKDESEPATIERDDGTIVIV
jgi:hypothetical protein